MSTFLTFLTLFLILLTGCGNEAKDERKPSQRRNMSCEYVIRSHDTKSINVFPPKLVPPPEYPWYTQSLGTIAPITKEYFYCKGSNVNLPRIILENGKETNRYHDCGGVEKHSLPLCDGNEFIYPILIDLLNWIQDKTKKQVIITSGHRCPSHNSWVDPSPQNATSKHCLGAEVDFYVSGYEQNPDAIITLVMQYYKTTTKYLAKKEYIEFNKFEKPTNVKTKPIYNKEIFVKKFLSSEGRNLDNRHPYPYISIQVRFDRDRNVAVVYSWDKSQNFLRK